jgi:hypothetical protein
VTDLWESPEQFNRFAESRLMAGVKQVGIEGEPEVECMSPATCGPAFEGAAA